MLLSIVLGLFGCASEPVAPTAEPAAPVAPAPVEVAPAAPAPGARTADGIRIKEAYARAMPGAATNSAAFVTLESPTAGRLVGARADVSEAVELHTHVDEAGVMQMRKIDGIDLPAGQAVEMKPGGLHVMFIGLKAPLVAGQEFELTLVFADGSEHSLRVPIREIAAEHG